MNQKLQNRQRLQKQYGFLHRYIRIMYVLKGNFKFGKSTSLLLLLLNPLSSIFITLQSERLINYKQNWIYQLLEFILRPDQVLGHYFLQIKQYLFILPLSLLLIFKYFSFKLQSNYFESKSQEQFFKNIKGQFIKQTICILLSSYYQLISSYLFTVFFHFCITSLKHQLLQTHESQSYNLLVSLNIFTILLLLIEIVININIMETPITHQVTGIDRTKITILRFIYQLILTIQVIMTIKVNATYFEFVQATLALVSQGILLIDQFVNNVYLLSYQQYPLFVGIAMNLTFHIHILIFSWESKINLPLFLYFILILQILLNCNLNLERRQWVKLFKQHTDRGPGLKNTLIKLLNNDISSKAMQVFINALIASEHSQNCTLQRCTFCQHQFILFPNQACAITSKMNQIFILNNIQQIINKSQLTINNETNLTTILSYAFLYYDFGWIMKSIKILFQLKLLEETINHNLKKTQYQSKKEFSSIDKQSSIFQNLFPVTKNISYRQDLRLISSVKLQFILNTAKDKMKSTLGTSLQADQQQIISNYIEEHVSQDVLLTNLEEEIFSIIHQKTEFLQKFITYRILDQQINKQIDFSNQIFQICNQFYEVDHKLKQCFQSYPSLKLHRMFSFFIGEVLCNYKRAIKFFSTSEFLEIQKLQYQQIKNFNINSPNVDYIILETKDDLENFTIRQFSYNFFQHYSDTNSNQQEQLEFDNLLPKNLIPYHPYFVKEFLETGHSKFYKMFDITYIRNSNQLLNSTNMCFSITNLFQTNNITFAVFLQQASQDQIYIVVDGPTFNCTFTQNLLILAGWNEKDINTFSQQQKFDSIHISKFFPNFARIIKGIKQKQFKVDGIQLHLPYPPENIVGNLPHSLLQIDYLKYQINECDVIILKNIVNQYEYYVVNILKIAEQHQTIQSQIKLYSQARISCDSLFDQSLFLNHLDHSRIGEINAITFLNKNLPASILNNFVNQSPLASLKNNDSSSVKQRGKTPNHDSSMRFFSPKQQSQQQFFSVSQFQNEEYINSNKIDADELSESRVKQIQMSSYTLLSISQFDGKFNLIEKIVSFKSTKYLDKLPAMIFVWHFTFLLYLVLILMSLYGDIGKEQSHIQMLSFYASIMGPHDLFFSFRVTITAYQQMQREGFISIEMLSDLTDPYYQHIELGYTELRDSLYEQLNNQYLNQFLDDTTVTMMYMNENETAIYPVELEFREALFVILQYQFANMITFTKRESTAGKPFQISLYANYFMLHFECEKLVENMKIFVLYNLTIMKEKYLILLVLFIFIQAILYLLIQCYQSYYFMQLDRIISLLNTINIASLEAEVINYENLIFRFSKSHSLIYFYNPIENYFTHLEKAKTSFSSQQMLIPEKFTIGLSRRNKARHYLLLVGLLALMLSYIFTVLSLNNNYFYLYPETVDLFQKFQNLKLRAGNLFLYRELFFQWSNFTFLTEKNKLELYNLMNKALTAIDDYQVFTQNRDFTQYLIDGSFEPMFNSINHQDLCTYIDEKFTNLTNQYCDIAFDKVMLNGMIQTLAFIENQIRMQQTINNFTKRTEVFYYEQEGAQIVTRVFFVLSSALSNSINSIIDLQLLIIQVLSLAYIIYSIIIFVIINKYYRPYLGRLFKIFKRTIHILPFETLLNNQQLGIKLKELVHRLQFL